MATRQQLESALRNAHAAGDKSAARQLANAIQGGQYDDAPQQAIQATPQPESQSRQEAIANMSPMTRALVGAGPVSENAQIAAAAMGPAPGYNPTGVKSVFNAPELNEFSMRAFKAGLGGLLERNPEELQMIIQSNYPEAQFQEVQGQPGVVLPSGEYQLNPEGIDLLDVAAFGTDVAAFTPAAGAAKIGVSQLAKRGIRNAAARTAVAGASGAAAGGATQAGLQGIEAATGGEFNLEDVALEAAFQGGFDILAPFAKRAAPFIGKIRERIRARNPRATYEDVAESVSSRDAQRAIPEVMADPEVMAAARQLGINVNPGVYSTNEIYREIENSLKMIPGSQLSANEKETVRLLGERADELLVDYTGTLDKTAIGSEIQERIGNTIVDLEKQEGAMYDTLRETIPPSLRVIPESTVGHIDGLIAQLGEVSDLDPTIRRMYERIRRPGGVNYALLDQFRKDIGAGLKGRGVFRDASKNQMELLYGTLTDDTMRAAEFFGVDELAQTAKDLTKKRKSLEEAAVAALGRDLNRSIMSELGSGVRQLQRGEQAKFDTVMEAIPPDMRQTAAIAALNDVFAGGARTTKGFSLSGFTNAYEALQRNKSMSQRLFNYIPTEARTRLDNIYKVSKGLMEQNKRDLNNPSGTARAVIGALDAPNGVLTKLYRVGSRMAAGAAATSPFDAGATGAAVGFMSALQSARTKATQAADQMLSSPAFSDAMQRYIDGDSQAANGILNRLKSTRDWIDRQPAEVKRSIARQGLIQYLTSEEDNDSANPN